MLYVSRKLSGNRAAIIDTDDSVESIVSTKELNRLVNLGLQIQGVRTFGVPPCVSIAGIDVYQAEDCVTSKQVRTKLLRGVTITKSGSTITAIDWDDTIVDKDLQIRLSEYGTHCAECLFNVARVQPCVSPTFIIDNKIKIRRHSFDGAAYLRAKFDLRELGTDKDTIAGYVYQSMFTTSVGVGTELFKRVLDNDKRKECWVAYGVVRCGYNPGGKQFSYDASCFVARKIYKSLEVHSKKPLEFSYRHEAFAAMITWRRDSKGSEEFWNSKCQDYDAVRKVDNLAIFNVLKLVTELDLFYLSLFNFYLYFMKPVPEIKKLYVDFCNRAYPWLYLIDESLKGC